MLLFAVKLYGQAFTKITTGVVVTDDGNSFAGGWADYDNDGDLDLFVSNNPGNNFLYANNGDGTFTKVTTGAIVSDGGSSRGSSWGDYDNDGDLDLFVANGGHGFGENNFLYRNNGDGTFAKITTGVVVNDGGHSSGCNWVDMDNDGDLDLFVANESFPNFLYENNGDGTFGKITAGDVANEGFKCEGSAWADFNNDGYLDLFVARSENNNNLLYINNGEGNVAKVEATPEKICGRGGLFFFLRYIENIHFYSLSVAIVDRKAEDHCSFGDTMVLDNNDAQHR